MDGSQADSSQADSEVTRARQPLAARLAGAGARGASRLADATGVDRALDRAAEEAIVRALESPAVERALVRVLESPAAEASMDRMLASEELEKALLRVLDSELVDRVWERLLASDEAQKLVERIAGAPEIRQAIASQGIGLVSDVGRQVRRLTDHLDDGLERLARRVTRSGRVDSAEGIEASAQGGTSGRHATEGAEGDEALPRQSIGLITRGLAALLDAAILNGIFLLVTALVGFALSALFEMDGASAPVIVFGAGFWLIFGGLYLLTFWSLAGQTPGMRLLSIRIEREGTHRLGWRCSWRRLIGVGISVVCLGIPFLRALTDPEARTFHDRLAGTRVVSFDPAARR